MLSSCSRPTTGTEVEPFAGEQLIKELLRGRTVNTAAPHLGNPTERYEAVRPAAVRQPPPWNLTSVGNGHSYRDVTGM